MRTFKRVIRDGLPETNSSSSHSIIINKLSKNSDVDYLSLLPNKDGIIEIPKPTSIDFGNVGFSPINSPLAKLQLVVSLAATNANSLTELGKILGWLKVLLCNFTGAKDVRFLGLSDLHGFRVEDLEDSNYFWEYIECCFSLVDHQSRSDLQDCIFENKEIILDFIFNKDSWLFLSSDSCNNDSLISEKLSKDYNLVEATAHIDFGYNIGRVDFPLYNYPKLDCISIDIIYGRNHLLSNLIFDFKNKEFRYSNVYLSSEKDDELTLYNGYSESPIINLDGEFFVLFNSNKLHTEIIESTKKSIDHYHDVWSFIKNRKDILGRDDYYMLFKIEFNLENFPNVL